MVEDVVKIYLISSRPPGFAPRLTPHASVLRPINLFILCPLITCFPSSPTFGFLNPYWLGQVAT